MNRQRSLRRTVRRNVGKTLAVMAATSVVALAFSQPAAAEDNARSAWNPAQRGDASVERMEPNTARTLRGVGPAATTTTQWENRIEGVMRPGEEGATPSAARCSNVSKRISQIITNYNQNYTRNGLAYAEMVKRAQTLITTLQAKNLDVTKIQADVTVLQNKIAEFQTDKLAAINQLKVAQGISCTDNPTEFMTALQKAMSLVRTTRSVMLDIRSFYINTLRQDIIALVGEKK